MNKIAVIGCGFVGGTIAKALENAGNDVVRIDPKYNSNKLEDFVDKIDGAVICLPTSSFLLYKSVIWALDFLMPKSPKSIVS